MKQIIIILALILAKQNILISQNIEQNQAKYWLYKERLEKYFLNINNTYTKSAFQWKAGTYDYNFMITENIKENGIYHLADVTWYLGMYIGVLSTEYKLLKLNHFNFADWYDALTKYPEQVSNIFKASRIIESSVKINHKAIAYHAGERITLKPGFRVYSGNVFKAKIRTDLFKNVEYYNLTECEPLPNNESFISKVSDVNKKTECIKVDEYLLKIYPNTATQNIQISLLNDEIINKIIITNISRIELYSETVNSISTNIDISMFSEGCILLQYIPTREIF